ncbi:hypothetical protein MBMB1_1766 [Methanobacterium sp. MB1]|jgi:hypothetical protein|nr:hypothetical protein MBMB1_1515 [Methanobacterium sp. MB1]CDG65848.1 hypothetical protein MBMB1_1766 [Methanobacterium sp. MB1]
MYRHRILQILVMYSEIMLQQTGCWKPRTKQLGSKEPRSSHPSPIKQVFYSYPKSCLFSGETSGLDAFSLYNLARSCPAMPYQTTGRPEAPTARSSRTGATFPSDNKTIPLDSNQPVSRRSKPSSRSPLMGEQPHPWVMLHTQDGKNRHRSSKPQGRYGLLPATTQLSPR